VDYRGPERRSGISEADMERIADIAAQKALDRVYADVGKGVLKKIALVVGAAFIGLLMWMGTNHISLK
jgi:hypothetical protein